MTELNARKFAAETVLADARRRIESDLDESGAGCAICKHWLPMRTCCSASPK